MQSFIPALYLKSTSIGLKLVFTLFMVAFILNSPILRIRGASVEGMNGLTQSEVEQTKRVAELPEGANLIRTNLEETSRNLVTLPWIKSAKASKTLMGRVIFKVVPLTPVAHLRYPSGDFEVDAEKVAIRPYNSNRPLPEIDSVEDPKVLQGKAVELNGLDGGILIWTKHSSFGPVKVNKIFVDAEHNLCLNMSDTVSVQLGTESDLVEKLGKLQNIYSLRPDIGADLQSIVLKSTSFVSGEPRIGGKVGTGSSHASNLSSPSSQSQLNE